MSQLVQKTRSTAKMHDHIRELAMRLVASIITLVIASFIVYAFYEPILNLLRSPLGAPLYYSSPSGSFALVMKICFMGALTIAIPVLVYNLVMFIRPALEKIITLKRVYTTAIVSSLLAIAGAAFAYCIILPGSLKFFAGFQVSGLNALISADSYLGFVTNIIITFIIVFQLPLLISFIDHIKPLKPKKLIGFEKWIVMGSLVIALIAPFSYDLITSLLIALPIIVLYNLSILMIVIQHAQSAHNVRKEAYSTAIAKSATKTEIIIDELLLEQLSDELVNLKQPVVSPVNTIKPQPKSVQPPAWAIERKQRREALLEQSRIFSEVNCNATVKRVLASQ
ncbi:MAG: twin-arginine translocase subunit TatC [Candidatus Saccharimonadales bacterium]